MTPPGTTPSPWTSTQALDELSRKTWLTTGIGPCSQVGFNGRLLSGFDLGDLAGVPAVTLRKLLASQAGITAQLTKPNAERFTRSLEAGHDSPAYELAYLSTGMA